jgi:hypothetical protein
MAVMDERHADTRVARAIDHVLESEHAARDAIAQCERECAEALERAREHRRAILDRAQKRILALNERSTSALQRRLAAAGEDRAKTSAAVSARFSDPLRHRRSLERFAASLTTLPAEPQDDAS